MKLFTSQSQPISVQIHHIRERASHFSTEELWIACIFFFLFLNILNIIFAVFLFIQTSHIPEDVSTGGVSVVETVDREELSEILSRFESRVVGFESKKTIPPHIPAPIF